MCRVVVPGDVIGVRLRFRLEHCRGLARSHAQQGGGSANRGLRDVAVRLGRCCPTPGAMHSVPGSGLCHVTACASAKATTLCSLPWTMQPAGLAGCSEAPREDSTQIRWLGPWQRQRLDRLCQALRSPCGLVSRFFAGKCKLQGSAWRRCISYECQQMLRERSSVLSQEHSLSSGARNE